MLRTNLVPGLILAAVAAFGVASCGGKSGGASSPGAKLRVTALDPATGSPDGGQPITIKGEGFMSESRAITVYFGDSQAQVIDVPSDHEVKIEAPAGPAGQAVDVLIAFEPGGEIKLPHAFTFTGP